MKLTLEKDDLVQIIGKHFNIVLDPEKVSIQPEPFEITVSGIPLSESEAPPSKSNVVPIGDSLTVHARAVAAETDKMEKHAHSVPERDDDNATEEPPPSGLDGIEGDDNGSLNPMAILAKSKELADAIDRENPALARSSRGTMKKPPKDFNDEIS